VRLTTIESKTGNNKHNKSILEEIPLLDSQHRQTQNKKHLFTTKFNYSCDLVGPVLTVQKVKQQTFYDPRNPYRMKKSECSEMNNDNKEDEDMSQQKEPKRWLFDEIREFHKRRYQLQKIAMEFYLYNGNNFLLILVNTRERDDFCKKLSNIVSNFNYRLCIGCLHSWH
jgi:hypothetical protein